MKSTPDPDLTTLYRRFLRDFPSHHAILAGGQAWTWIDSGVTNRGGEKTILLLPGLFGEAETSFLYIQALAGHMRVVSVAYPPSVGQVDCFCEGLRTLMDHLGIPQVTLLGGSSGGFVAQVFARRVPARTSGLILTHTGLPSRAQARANQGYLRLLRVLPFAPVRRLMILSVFAFFPRLTPVHAFWRAHFRGTIRCLSRAALRNRIALMHDFHGHNSFQPGDLAIEPGSILLMEMQQDHLTSPAERSEMRAVYPGAQLHVFTDTAHFDSVEKPDEQIRVIADFMTSRT